MWPNLMRYTDIKDFIILKRYRYGTQSIYYELCARTIEKGGHPIDAA